MESNGPLVEFPLPAYRNVDQIISLPIDDGQSAEDIECSDVKVLPCRNTIEKPSSMLTLKNEIDFRWEEKYYMGQLVSVHRNANLLAYAVTDHNTGDGIVRVSSKKQEGRLTLKGMKGAIHDLAFCESNSLYLAVVDETANLFVFLVDDFSNKNSMKPVIHAVRDERAEDGRSHRVVWCPFSAAEEDTDPDTFALLIGSKAEVWHLTEVRSRYSFSTINATEPVHGVQIVTAHSDFISYAVFSPDAVAIATASYDGTVQFHQCYLSETPKVLHRWQPHNGEPVTTIHFLDNLSNPDAEIWKFAITGSKNNSELKLWACKTWVLIQTLVIPNDGNHKLKAAITPSASYIVLSDHTSRLLFVYKTFVSDDEETAYIQSVAAYLVPFPILSFSIVGVLTDLPTVGELDDDDFDDEEEEEVDNLETLHFYLVQPKSLQDCKVQLIKPAPGKELTHSKLMEHPPELPPLPALNLMTPNEFTSPAKPNEPQIMGTIKTEPAEPNGSDASSPSQEVQDILNFKEDDTSRIYPELTGMINGKVSDAPILRGDVTCFNASGGGPPPAPVQPPPPPLDLIHPPTPNSIIPPKRLSMDPKADANQRMDGALATDGTLNKAVLEKLDELLTVIKRQDNQIKELKTRVEAREAWPTFEQIERLINGKTAHLEAKLRQKEVQEAEREEVMLSALAQAVENIVSVKLTEVVPAEVRKGVIPVIANDVETFTKSLRKDVNQKISSTDHLLRENINKLVHSKPVMDELSSSLTSSIRHVITDTCKEMMASFLLPRLEKSLEKVFHQVHEVFTAGMREGVVQIKEDLERVKEDARKVEKQLKHSAENNNATAAEMRSQFQVLSEELKQRIGEIIQMEMRNLQRLHDHSAVATSRAMTPAMQVHERQSAISQYITAGQYNTAFQEALSAADLNLVVFACEKIGAEQLFSRSQICPLQQPVLMSLIQQLTADLTKHSDVKCSYLTEAVLRLEPFHVTTKEHLPVVIAEVERNITSYLCSHQTSKHATDLHRILRVLKLLAGNTAQMNK